jgi:uncharacterized MnhB-related membrane protein
VHCPGSGQAEGPPCAYAFIALLLLFAIDTIVTANRENIVIASIIGLIFNYYFTPLWNYLIN